MPQSPLTDYTLEVSSPLRSAFVALAALVVAQNLWLVARAAPSGASTRLVARTALVAMLWIAGHLGIAVSARCGAGLRRLLEPHVWAILCACPFARRGR